MYLHFYTAEKLCSANWVNLILCGISKLQLVDFLLALLLDRQEYSCLMVRNIEVAFSELPLSDLL